MSDTENEFEEAIVFPSGKLGAITRVKNQIRDCMEDYEIGSVLVDPLTEKLKTKISNFEKACEIERKKNCSPEELESFDKWFHSQRKDYDILLKPVISKHLLQIVLLISDLLPI